MSLGRTSADRRLPASKRRVAVGKDLLEEITQKEEIRWRGQYYKVPTIGDEQQGSTGLIAKATKFPR